VNALTEKIRSGLCRFVGEIILEAGLVSEEDLNYAIEIQKETHELLGQILVRNGHLTQQQLADILEIQLNNRFSRTQRLHKHLGEILLHHQAISRWQLAQALQEQGVRANKIGHILVDFGYTTRGKVEQALSDQAIGAVHKASSRRVSLGELLLKSNRLTPEQLHQALELQHQTHDYLGNVLVQQGVLSEEELEDVLTTQLWLQYSSGGNGRSDSDNQKPVNKKIGEILVDTHQLTREQLTLAVEEQHRNGLLRLGDILVEKGLLPFKELMRALRLQKRLATLVMSSALGATLLASCGTTHIPPNQMYGALTPAVMMTQSVSTSQVLAGPFKVLQVDNGQRIQIYQNGSKVIENVPFFRQGSDNTCGQAVLTSLLNYWGTPMTYEQVVSQANPNNLPTTDDAITNYLRKKGLKAQDFRSGVLDNLINQVNQGRPTPVLLDFGGLSQEHYVLVVGYNQKKGTLVMHDSLEGPYVEMDMNVFQKMWDNRSISGVHIFASGNYKRLYFDVFR
jgi:predicted double-glycine peptidase